jgi:hypothetical protein
MTTAAHFKIQVSRRPDRWDTEDVVDTEEEAIEMLQVVRALEPAAQARILKVTITQEVIEG